MCGIAGFFDPSISAEESRARLDTMLSRIAHRGPDGAGTLIEGGLAMGMRRLSIIDLAGGSQPIWNEDGTIAVIFNGEIYNYRQLRGELIDAEHVFKTASDTEVLVHMYEERNFGVLHELRGMFAFALYDRNRQRLMLGRDQFGQKPLYFTRSEGRVAFASELKCLLTLPWVRRDLRPEAYLDYVSWLSLPSPDTHFAGIEKLAAGCFLEIPLDAPASKFPRRWWAHHLHKEPTIEELDPAADALDAALRESIELHLRADVPVGVLLSSGLDSRVVSAYAQDIQGGTMQTFTVGFGAADSELEGAAKTAAEIRSQHHTLELNAADLAGEIERVAWHLDEPVGDPAAFAVLRICELARQHVKVLLSGEGADELFGGYDTRYLGIRHTLQRSDRFRPLARLLPQARGSDTRWQRFLMRIHQTRREELTTLRQEGFPGDVRHPRGLTPAQLATLRERTRSHSEREYRVQRDLLSEVLAFDTDWQLAESLLQKADKMSMAASIELRTPLLDVEIAKVAGEIHSDLKLPPEGPGKLVLRHTLARKLNEPLQRPKKGFPVPLAAWLRGPLREQVEAELFSTRSQCLQQLDPQLLRAAWGDFQDGSWEGAHTLYALWLYEVWHRRIMAA